MKNGLHSLNAIANSLWMGPVHLWNIIGLQNIRNSEDSVSPKEQLLLRSYGGWIYIYLCNRRDCCGCDWWWLDLQLPMQSVFITTKVGQIKSCPWWSVFDIRTCDKGWWWLVVGRWISPGTLVSAVEILLKVALNTVTLTLFIEKFSVMWSFL